MFALREVYLWIDLTNQWWSTFCHIQHNQILCNFINEVDSRLVMGINKGIKFLIFLLEIDILNMKKINSF